MGSLAQQGSYLGVSPYLEDEKLHRRQLASALNNALQGKLNCTLDVSLRKDTVSTTVSDVRAGPNSAIVAVPTSANGGIALDGHYITSRMVGSFVINHVSTSTSDCTATLAIFG